MIGDGASRMFGAPSEIELGGRKWEVRSLTASQCGEIERQILKLRPNPLQVYRESKDLLDDPADREWLRERATKEAFSARYASDAEIAGWLGTLPGQAFSTWVRIRHADPALTVEQVETWIRDEYQAELEINIERGMTEQESSKSAINEVLQRTSSAADIADGADELGNLTGPIPNGTESGSI